jgi:alpha-1,3-glucan synthase
MGWSRRAVHVSDKLAVQWNVVLMISSTCIWLWLGVLDAIQGVGLGMILLQTLSRLHVCATLAGAQLLGSVVVMVARASAPDKVGPGNVFPNLAIWNLDTGENNPFKYWEFWLCLICQIIIVIGYL